MVVVVVDDAHWADRPSLPALVFALRRLVADPVLVLIGVRDAVDRGCRRACAGSSAGSAGSRHRAAAGSTSTTCATSPPSWASPLSPVAARRLRDGTQGNPLHARALLEEFPPQCVGPGRAAAAARRVRSGCWCADRYPSCSRGRPPARRRRRRARPALPAAAGGRAGGARGAAGAVGRGHGCGRCIAEPGPGTPWSRVSVPAPARPRRRCTTRSAWPAAARCTPPRRRWSTEPAAAALRHRVAAATVPDDALAADLEAFAAPRGRTGRPGPRPGEPRRRRPAEPGTRATGSGGVLEAVTWMLQNGDAATAAAHRGEIARSRRAAARQRARLARHGRRATRRRGGRSLRRAWAACRADTDPELRRHDRAAERDALATAAWTARAPSRGAGGRWSAPARTPSPHWAASTYLPHGLGYAGRTAESFAARRRRGRPGRTTWLEPRSARGHAAAGRGRPRRRPRRPGRRGATPPPSWAC